MRNWKKMKKLVCLLMSVGMVFSGNSFTGYSAQAETLDEITLMEESAPVSAQEEIGEAISFEEAENVNDDSLFGEEDDIFFEDLGNGLPDADVTEDTLFVDVTAAAPEADSIDDVNGFENADDYGYIEHSDEFEEPESITEADEIEEEETDNEIFEEPVFEESINAAEGSGTDAGIVVDGQSFVDALGGSEYASYTLSSENNYTVTLLSDVTLDHELQLQSGSFILDGTKTVSRTEGYTGTLLKIYSGVSLTLGGNVILDGGAIWKKDGEPSSPAEGAANSGASSTGCLVDNEGSFTLTDSAVIQNNDATGGYRAGAIVSTGPVTMQGGMVRNCDGGSGSILAGNGSSFTMSGGEISGNRGTSDDYWSAALIDFNSNLIFTGGTIRKNTGRALAYTHNRKLTVTGGNYTDNSGYVFFGSMYGDGIFISGGVFSGNGGAADAWYETYTKIHLSGNPVFETETDLLRGPVVIDGAITNDQEYVLIPKVTDLGYQAVGGDAELIAAYHGRFILSGEGTSGLVVNSRGRIDTNPTTMVSDGAGFVEALGGSEYASFTESEGVCTVTLSQDTVRSNYIFVESGTYILTGSGTISRAEGYTGTVLKISNQASVTLGGEVVLDGGAVWRKDGSSSSPAEGAANSGVVSTGCLVDNEGSFTLTDSAVIQNNDATGGYRAGAIVSTGPVSMQGGMVRNCDGGSGSILAGNGSSFTMSGGEISGNRGTSSDYWSAALIDFNSNLTFIGGTIRKNTGRALAYTHNRKLTVTGGNYTDNSGYVFFGSMYGDGIFISGGVFSGNGGAVDAYYETSTTIHLSGNPVFETETDLLRGSVVIEGGITSETDIRIMPTSYDPGAVVITGTNNYVLSESDVEKCSLSDAPEGAELSFDQSNNRVLLTYMTPVLVKVEINKDEIIYDGQPVEPGVDFTVSVFLYEDNIQGDEITENYMVGGGLLGTRYRYRKYESTGIFTDGLPTDAGKYTVVVEVIPDNLNNRASGQGSVTLEIKGPTVTWMNGRDVLEKDENCPVGTAPSYDGEEPVRDRTEQYSYVFAGWAVEDGQEDGTLAADLPVVTEDITYYAAFRKIINQYTVTFTDGFGNVLKTQTLDYGSTAVAPSDPSCDGLTFSGWDVDYSYVTGDLTITATWTTDVSFDANGGSGTMEPVSMTTGDPVPGCDFTAPQDKKFKEWNTKADGSGSSYQPGDSIIVESDLILYAQWENAVPPEKTNIANAAVALSGTEFTYNGSVRRPVINKIGGRTLTEGTDYTTVWSDASSVNAGIYTVTITGKGNYTGRTKANYQIIKAANPLTVKGKTAKIKYSKLKKKKQKLAVSKAIKITGAQGTVTYKLVSVKKAKFKKYFTVNAKTGKITVKKKLKKGTYKIKVKVTAAGNDNYNSLTKTVTFKVKVK